MKELFVVVLYLVVFFCGSSLAQQPIPVAHSEPIDKPVVLKEGKKLSDLDLWKQSAYRSVVRNFYPTGDVFGESVKIQVNLDDAGFISSYKIISTSGSERLNYSAVIALKKTEPFDLSRLSDSDKPDAKNIVFTFSPKQP